MKRFWAAVLTGILLIGSAQAYRVPNDTSNYGVIATPGINNDPEVQAQALKALGLFLGTEQGFALRRTMTRGEAAAMLVRYLGGEQQAQSGKWKHPFTDVPAWADGYVGWLFQKGLTKGVSEKKYGAAQPITGLQYATFLSRVLTDADDYMASGMLTSTEVSNFSSMGGGIKRADAVALSVRALTRYGSKEGKPLAAQLLEQGVFTKEQFGNAMWDVLPPDYHYDGGNAVVSTLAGVPYAVCPLDNLELDFDMAMVGGFDSTQPYVYAYRLEEGALAVYQLDAKTLTPTRLGAHALPDGIDATIARGNYVMQLGGKDYILEQYWTEQRMGVYGALLSWDGQTLTEEVSAANIGDGAAMDDKVFSVEVLAERRMLPEEGGVSYNNELESFAIRAKDAVFLVTKDGVHRLEDEDGWLVYQDASCVITQLIDEKQTVLTCIGVDGAVRDRYTVPAGGIRRGVSSYPGGSLYGDAGWYTVDQGRLTQKTDMPVVDVVYCRIGASPSDPYLLTHDLGEPLIGMKGGNKIVQMHEDGTISTILDNKPAHGIAISKLEAWGSLLAFYSADEVGMQHYDQYTYLVRGDKVSVQNYTPGYAEAASDAGQTPEEYQLAHIKAEQARLDALGIGVGAK